MNSGSRCGLTCTTEPKCLSVTPAKLITAHMKENISHDQCPSGGGKNKQSCFHSLPLTNIPLHTSASCHSAPWSALWRPVRQQWKTSRAAERKKVFWLENCLPSVLPVHKYKWEFEEFAKQCVIAIRCEDRPNIIQVERADEDEPFTVDGGQYIHLSY